MDGAYKDKIYELFGKERTDAELEDYLAFDFFQDAEALNDTTYSFNEKGRIN